MARRTNISIHKIAVLVPLILVTLQMMCGVSAIDSTTPSSSRTMVVTQASTVPRYGSTSKSNPRARHFGRQKPSMAILKNDDKPKSNSWFTKIRKKLVVVLAVTASILVVSRQTSCCISSNSSRISSNSLPSKSIEQAVLRYAMNIELVLGRYAKTIQGALPNHHASWPDPCTPTTRALNTDDDKPPKTSFFFPNMSKNVCVLVATACSILVLSGHHHVVVKVANFLLELAEVAFWLTFHVAKTVTRIILFLAPSVLWPCIYNAAAMAPSCEGPASAVWVLLFLLFG
mmetsp:Transcript_10976/g.27805  ORF Transcript_10976/g.27805 Transcript_10976/m.27805 type:complete len:287 (-) Transcript_10976:681-1541(-)